MTEPATIAADYTLRPSELAATLTLLVEARQPCIVWGPPGCAKSDIARQVAAALGRLYIDVRALLLDPVDLRGIPWRSMNVLERMLAEVVVRECHADGVATDVPALVRRYEAVAELLDQRTRWAPPSFLPPSHSGEQFLINLEELPSAVPMVSKVQRHGADSGIYRVATALRENRAPELPPLDTNLKDAGDVAYTSDISLENIERLWRQAGGAARTIILSPTRKGDGGVDRINSHLQKTIGLDRPAIHYLDDVHGWIPWLDTQGRPLCANDQIMVSVNDYEADIRNGDLGTITHVLDSPAPDGSVGIAEIDGREVPLTTNVLSSLTLGYAITVHKSQGSQWPVCILMLPTTAIPMTDRTLLYTAATRPTEQLVCCGDRRVLDQATKRPGTSSRRRSNLASLLRIQPNLTKRRNIEQNQLIHA